MFSYFKNKVKKVSFWTVKRYMEMDTGNEYPVDQEKLDKFSSHMLFILITTSILLSLLPLVVKSYILSCFYPFVVSCGLYLMIHFEQIYKKVKEKEPSPSTGEKQVIDNNI